MLKRPETFNHQVKPYLKRLWADWAFSGADVACWRLPDSETIHLLADFTRETYLNQVEIENRPPGFVIAPYQCADYRTARFLKADCHYALNLSDPSGWPPLPPQRPLDAKPPAVSHPATDGAFVGAQKEAFIANVKKARWLILEGEFEKLVPARIKPITLKSPFSLIQGFLEAERRYPSAFVSLVHLKEWGAWLGASPELLVELSAQQTAFRTIALAGTQSISDADPVKQVSWTQKAIEEQALVSRFIVDQFKRLRLREFVETGPKTVRSGRTAHLMSEFKVDLSKVDRKNLCSTMLNLLHPTSAVCGMPKEKALDFIAGNERFDRELFTGYLGPVNIENKTAVYVNLRCAKLSKDSALLFAGAGITRDSNPEEEWAETELKCRTMQDILV